MPSLRISVKKAFWLLAACLIIAAPVIAAPHWGEVIDLEQPDGTPVQVKFFGDEFYTRGESLDGYTVIRNKETGWIVYAVLNQNETEFVPTDILYDHRVPTDPELPTFQAFSMSHQRFTQTDGLQGHLVGLPKGLKLPREIVLQKHYQRRMELLGDMYEADAQTQSDIVFNTQAAPAPLTGHVVGLTILVEFQDTNQSKKIPSQNVDNYCNQIGYTGYGNNGSVRDYFRDVSNGELDYTNVVTDYIVLDHNQSYYDSCGGWGKSGELINEALTKLCNREGEGFFDQFTTYNGRVMALNIFYAGKRSCGWSEGLWPHKGWHSISRCGTSFGHYQMTDMRDELKLGTFCHENGHLIGKWPDLYDYGYESRGIGRYGLMASYGSGSNPNVPNPYFRYLKGWETLTDITNDNGVLRYHELNSFKAFKYSHPTNSREFFLIETCRKKQRRSSMPDEGLLIWHIDEDGSNNDEQMTPSLHYLVSVEQADGQFHLENNNNPGGGGDLFHAGYKTEFSDITLPDAKWWDGSSSGLYLHDISDIGDTMSFVAGFSNGLLAHYEGEGNTRDSNHNYHGTGYGIGYDTGLVGQAMSFDGDDFVRTPFILDPGRSEFSAFLWVKGSGDHQSIISQLAGTGMGRSWLHVLSDGSILTALREPGGDSLTSPPGIWPQDDKWHQVGLVWDGSRRHIYLDGESVVSDTSALSGLENADGDMIIGMNQTIGLNWVGLIDDVRFYYRSFHSDEVVTIYNKVERLLARYNFEGNADDSIGPHHAAIYGAAYGEGLINAQSLLLDGMDDYAVTPFLIDPATQPFSVFVWARGSGDQAASVLSQFAGAGTGRAWLHVDDNNALLTALREPGGESLISPPATWPTDDKWHHVGFVWDGQRRHLYLDGNLVVADAGNLSGLENANGEIVIGSNQNFGFYWDGNIDDFRIYTYPLNPDEILTLFNQAERLLARYNFEGNPDDSASANHAAIYGATYGQGIVNDQSLLLDGVDDYAEIPFLFNPATQPFSAFAWARGSGHQAASVLSQFAGGGTGRAWLHVDDNNALLTALREPGGESLMSPPTTWPADGEWHHVGFVWDGLRRYIYLDGNIVAADTDILSELESANGEIVVGSNQNFGFYWDGTIDDLRVYTYALPDAQIQEIFDVKPPSPSVPVFAVKPYRFDNTTVSMTSDSGTDDHGPVEYYFEEMTDNPGGSDSQWQMTPDYSDTNLQPGTKYTYVIYQRDRLGNVTEPSVSEFVFTLPEKDIVKDAVINLADLETLLTYWLMDNCFDTNLCSQTDLDASGQVNMADIAILSEIWLTPDP